MVPRFGLRSFATTYLFVSMSSLYLGDAKLLYFVKSSAGCLPWLVARCKMLLRLEGVFKVSSAATYSFVLSSRLLSGGSMLASVALESCEVIDVATDA